MPRPSKRSLASRNKLRDKFSGRIISSNDLENMENIDTRRAIKSEETADEYLEDWQLWNNYFNEQEAVSSLSLLFDDGSSTSRSKNGHYSKNSRTTEWRRRQEASRVKENEKISNYFKPVIEKNEEQKEENVTHTKKELSKIKMYYTEIFKFTQPVMNKRSDDSYVNSYNINRYSAVKYYFEKRLEGCNKGDVSGSDLI